MLFTDCVLFALRKAISPQNVHTDRYRILPNTCTIVKSSHQAELLAIYVTPFCLPRAFSIKLEKRQKRERRKRREEKRREKVFLFCGAASSGFLFSHK